MVYLSSRSEGSTHKVAHQLRSNLPATPSLRPHITNHNHTLQYLNAIAKASTSLIEKPRSPCLSFTPHNASSNDAFAHDNARSASYLSWIR